jgi:hypothetical protein
MKSLKAQQVAQKEKSLSSNKKSPIKEQARNNATVSQGSKRAGYVVKKQGEPLDQTLKHDVLTATDSKFGMNIGVTKNMDNFESLRVDVWATDVLREGETLTEANDRLGAELKKVLTDVVEEFLE